MAPVSDTETCTRYVTDRKNLFPSRTRVSFRVFVPRNEDADLSIARILGLDTVQVWIRGEDMAGRPSGRVVVGRADLTRPQVQTARLNGNSLDAIADLKDARHAFIVGWPTDREMRKSLAQQLAAEALQHIR